jgi:hypothetical protein
MHAYMHACVCVCVCVCVLGGEVIEDGVSVKKDLLQSQKRPKMVSKATNYSVKRDLCDRRCRGRGRQAAALVHLPQSCPDICISFV